MGPHSRGRSASEANRAPKTTKFLPVAIFLSAVCLVAVSIPGSDGPNRIALVAAAEGESPGGGVQYREDEAREFIPEEDFQNGNPAPTTAKNSSSERRYRRRMNLTKGALFSTSVIILGALFVLHYYGVDNLSKRLFAAAAPPLKESPPKMGVISPANKNPRQPRGRRFVRSAAVVSVATAILLAGTLAYQHQFADLAMFDNLRDVGPVGGGEPVEDVLATEPVAEVASDLLTNYSHLAGALGGALGFGAGVEYLASRRMRAVKADLRKAEEERNRAQAEKRALESEVAHLQQGIEEADDELRAMRIRNAGKSVAAVALRRRVAGLERERDELARRAEQLRVELEEKDKVVEEHRELINALEALAADHGVSEGKAGQEGDRPDSAPSPPALERVPDLISVLGPLNPLGFDDEQLEEVDLSSGSEEQEEAEADEAVSPFASVQEPMFAAHRSDEEGQRDMASSVSTDEGVFDEQQEEQAGNDGGVAPFASFKDDGAFSEQMEEDPESPFA